MYIQRAAWIGPPRWDDASWLAEGADIWRQSRIFLPTRRGQRVPPYLLPGLTAGISARSGGRFSAGNVSTFISIKLKKGQPKSGLFAPLRSTITPTAET